MRFMRRKSAGGPAAGTPAPRRPAWTAPRRLALACLALATLGYSGCASDPCGGGCGFGSGFGSGLRNATSGLRDAAGRMFNHCKKCKGSAPIGGCDTCGGGVVEGVPVEGAVIPGPIVSPPGTTISPSKENPPTILDPLPPAGSGGATRGGTTGSRVNPSGLRPTGNAVTYDDRPRSIESGVRGRGNSLAREAAPGASERRSGANPLDDLPPVNDLSLDVARRGVSPVPAEAEAIPARATPAPAAAPSNASASAPAREVEPPVLKASIDAPIAPGVAHFASVRPGISGGGAPGRDGLDWLKDKGIRTLVDLRAPGEVDAKFADEAKARGFRYVSLPVDAFKPDATRVAAFRDEITRAENHPVYFFDADGSRAGVIWYVHRLTNDKVDPQLASREAAELGLTEKSTWVAATRLLDATRAAANPAAPAAQPAPKASAPAASPSASRDAETSVTTLLAPLINVTRPALSAANPSPASPPASAR